jgi:PAS domain S-box-containing protein
MNERLRLLLVEDCTNDAFLIVSELQQGGLDAIHERVETIDDVKTALALKKWDLIVCDFCLRGFNGLEVLVAYHQMGLDIPFIMVSGQSGEDLAVQALKAGAHEYLVKKNLARLVPAVSRELRAARERQIRRQVQERKAYMALVVESCNDAIIGETLEGTVITWNAGAERLYGYTASEIVGRSVSILIPSYRPEELPEMLQKLSRGEPLEAFETIRVRKDGSSVQVSLAISPIKDASERIVGASTVARDITQRKQEENERLSLIQDLTAALSVKIGLDQSNGDLA